MPVPKWVAQVNKRTFNRVEIKRGKRPVLTHVGRRSGKTHHTPMDAHRIDGGFIFFPMYGPDSDWVKNVLQAGTAFVKVQDDEFALVNPTLISRQAALEELPASTTMPPAKLHIDTFLRMDLGE